MAGRRIVSAPYGIYSDRGIASISLTLAGRRIRETLSIPYRDERTGDAPGRAARDAAATRYAELVAGRVEPKAGCRVTTHLTLHELRGLFLEAAELMWPKSWKTIRIHLRTVVKWAEVQQGLTPIEHVCCDEGPTRFARHRLLRVVKSTVNKETADLFNFLGWCRQEGHLDSLPPRPEMPKKHKGTRSGTQREKAVPISRAQALSIIQLLPEYAARGGRRKDKRGVKGAFLVRDRFMFAYETFLRPSTVSKLEVPRHWRPGRTTLSITADIDKNEYAREVPLSEAALAILERHAPQKGVIFGRHDVRNHLKAAAAKVLPPEHADDFAQYDFRHGGITHAVEASGNLPGVAFLAGHTQVTTTNIYTHGTYQQAAKVVEAVRNVSGTLCEGRGSNSHASYGASTSTQRDCASGLNLADLARQGTSGNDRQTSVDDSSLSGLCQDLAVPVAGLSELRSGWDELDAFCLGAS